MPLYNFLSDSVASKARSLIPSIAFRSFLQLTSSKPLSLLIWLFQYASGIHFPWCFFWLAIERKADSIVASFIFPAILCNPILALQATSSYYSLKSSSLTNPFLQGIYYVVSYLLSKAAPEISLLWLNIDFDMQSPLVDSSVATSVLMLFERWYIKTWFQGFQNVSVEASSSREFDLPKRGNLSIYFVYNCTLGGSISTRMCRILHGKSRNYCDTIYLSIQTSKAAKTPKES